ncbi:MAG: dGTPase, partial [Pseudomonadota bacterium]|nr:dGTPase [Pseudomonadota bacterium]
ALNACMREHGGFEHNLQSLRVVDLLEERYAEFDGLNLTFEAREGILKHCSITHAEKLGDVGARFLSKQQPSLEAQIANLADEIAYNNHDVDDGLRSGLITLEQLSEVQIFARHLNEVRAKYPALQGRRVITETVRRIINTLVLDLVNTTRVNIENSSVQTLAEVRAAPQLAAFSAALLEEHRELKRFLLRHLYRHYKVARMSSKAGRIITDLYTAFIGDARLLPPEHQARESLEGARAVADYIAGMTDRYAMREHRRIFAVEEIYG